MEKNYEIAIIGPKEVVLGFKAIGLKIRFSMNAEETLKELQKIKEEESENGGESKHAIIFILESHAKEIPEEEYKKVTADALPAVIAIPGPEGSTGFGIERLGQIVEKAIGSNILK